MKNPKRKDQIFFDLDRTLAERHSGDIVGTPGKPIPAMIRKVKNYLKVGHKVKIFTARQPEQFGIIQDWLESAGLPRLDCTNIKTKEMDVLFDDKSVGVWENTGLSHTDMLLSAEEEIKTLLELVDQIPHFLRPESFPNLDGARNWLYQFKELKGKLKGIM